MGASASSPSGAMPRSQFYWPSRTGGRSRPEAGSDSSWNRGSSLCTSCHEMDGVLLEQSDRLVLEVHDDIVEFKYVLVLKRRGGTIHLDDLADRRGSFSMRAIFNVYEELKAHCHCLKEPDRITSFVLLTTADFGSDVFDRCLLNVSYPGIALLSRHDPPGSPRRCFCFRYFPDDWQETIGANWREIEEFRHKLIVAVDRPEATPGACRLVFDRDDDCENDYEKVFDDESGYLELQAAEDHPYDEVFSGDECGESDRDIRDERRETRNVCVECEATRGIRDASDEAENPCDVAENPCDESENPCDETQNPYDEAENAYDEAENSCDEAENPYDEGENLCDELHNSLNQFDKACKTYVQSDESRSANDECDDARIARAQRDKGRTIVEERGRKQERTSVHYTIVKPLGGHSKKNKMAPLASQYSSQLSASQWACYSATSRDRHDMLLSTLEIHTSGLFRDDPTSALNSPNFFRDVAPFVDLLLLDNDRHCVVVASDAAPLSCLKVVQALLDVGDDRAIFDPWSLLVFGDWVDATLATGQEVALVVFWHGDGRLSAEEYLRGLPGKATNSRQKIVVVCQRGDEPPATGWRTIVDDWNIADVSQATRVRFFKMKIGFQGRATTVADFFRDVDDWGILSGLLLSRVVCRGRHEIAAADLAIDVDERRYVHRNFRWSLGCFFKGCLPEVPVSEELILKRRSSPSATIGVVRRGRLHVDGSEVTWKVNVRKNVHLMQWNGSCFIARDFEENHIQDECDLTTYKIKVVVVSGEPGAGKTVAVSHMLKELKIRNPDAWIVRVNLADSGAELHTLSAKTNFGLDDVLDLLCRTSNLPGQLERALLRAKMAAVVVFVDGFDEVPPKHAATVLRALKLLKGSPLRGLWVTTRPQWTRLLESALTCGSFAILPLDLRALLATCPDVDFVARAMVAPGLRVATRLIGAPLLATMLAEVVEGSEVDEAFDVVTLYARFLERRAGRRLFGLENATNRNYYARLALDALFPAEAETLLPQAAERRRDDGIVAASRGERRAFRHRTFAEFFVADFFAGRPRDDAAVVVAALRGRYLDESSDVIRLFLDHMLTAASPLHWAALHGNVRTLVAAARCPILDMSRILDPLSRTPLHLAAAYPGDDGDVVAALAAWLPVTTFDQPDALGLSPLAYAYASLGTPANAYALLIAACDECDEAFDVALRATLAAAQQRRGGAEAEALCDLVRSRFPKRMSDLRKCLYCAHFRRWHELNYSATNEGASVDRLVERMLEFFKAALDTERSWGGLLRAHNELVARVKGARHRWPSLTDFNAWLTRAVSARDVGALFKLRNFFRVDGWG